MKPQPPFMGVRELSEKLGVSRGHGYRLVHRGCVPSVRIGHAIRIPREALTMWLRGHVEAALQSVKQPARQRPRRPR
jgi:excisionase family DNA binding protein